MIGILFYITDIMFYILPNCLFNKTWTLKNCLKEYDYIALIVPYIILVLVPHFTHISVLLFITGKVLTYMGYIEDFINGII